MGAEVCNQVPLQSKAAATMVTKVRMVAGMAADVRYQPVFVPEALTAVTALMQLLACVFIPGVADVHCPKVLHRRFAILQMGAGQSEVGSLS